LKVIPAIVVHIEGEVRYLAHRIAETETNACIEKLAP
jgi:hypothetical protein